MLHWSRETNCQVAVASQRNRFLCQAFHSFSQIITFEKSPEIRRGVSLKGNSHGNWN